MVIMENDIRAWADLPSDVLNIIFSHTCKSDCIRFRLTCKSWQSVTIPIRRSVTIPSLMQSEWSQQFPWLLMFSKRRSLGIFNLFHPISNETYMMEIPELADAMFHCSKYGWLLMSKGQHSLFFFNPFTRCTINLPDLTHNIEFVSMSFTAPPTSSECKVYGYEYSLYCFGGDDPVGFYTWTCIRGTDHRRRWRLQAYSVSDQTKNPLFKSLCMSVFYKDVFYHLDVNGRLAVFDSEKQDKTLMWDDLPKPRPEKMISCDHPKYYLTECDGEFVSVFVGALGDPVHVYKLDWSDMHWERVQSLGNKTMFINDTRSLLISSKLKGTEDRIYFPSFKDGDAYYNRRFDPSQEDQGNEGVFYSLKTNKYHAFGSVFSHGEWVGTRIVHNCVWIEPNVDNTISKGVHNWFDPLPQDNNENYEDEDQWDDDDDGNDDVEEEEEEEEDLWEEIDDIEVNEEMIGELEEEPALEEEEEEEDCEKQMDVVEVNEEQEEEEEETASCALFPTSGSPFVVYNQEGRGYKKAFVSISQGTYFVRSVPDMRGMMCCASSHGWLVMLNDSYSTQCFLWNPISMEKIELPPMDNAYLHLGGCVLTSSPPDCVIMFIGMDGSCIFCRPNDQRWTRKYLSWKPGGRYLSNAAVCCKGKIYICFEDGASIKVLDYTTEYHTNDGNCLRVEKINFVGDLLENECYNCRASYLVECCGEVFLVLKLFRTGIQEENTLPLDFIFNVFRLNYSSSSTSSHGSWEKVESLGYDRVFFLGNNFSSSMSASKLEMKENYIFFLEFYDRHLYAFNMEDQTTTVALPYPHSFDPEYAPYWVFI